MRKLSEKRQAMLDKMIKIYGFEHEVTVAFAGMLENWDDTKECDKALEMILITHKEHSVMLDE